MFDSSSEHIASYYAASSLDLQIKRPSLQENLSVDVLIVGAGFTGLYTALRLAAAGKSVAIIEASRVGWGASGRNGGQIIPGFSCDMPPFEAALGHEGAKQVWQLVQQAAQEIRKRVAEHQIDCELMPGHLWTAVLPHRVKILTDWQQEASQKWGYEHLQFIPKNQVCEHIGSQRYQAALLDTQGGHLHPLKYVLGLARAAEALGVRIYENSKALSYSTEAGSDRLMVQTAQGQILANQLVLACNAYIDKLDTRLQKKIIPVGSYMIATEALTPTLARQLLPSGHAVSDNQFVLDYFRLSQDQRLLFGGKCSYTGRTPHNLTQGMRQDMLKVFPQLADTKIDFTWGGHLDISMPRTPDFGHCGNVYWAQGFSGHGIIPTCVAGRVLAEAICGDHSHLKLFGALKNPAFPGGERLAGLFQVLGMSYYRIRDYF
ncbi:FAD-binding oxidoreductase [Undibacterium sp.]|uniref:NAD(P)/FAD-dependent oxidoreductase n=1 Tax=Undibacterium sp. TaxID=1914977 RepID=UPI0025EFAD75|nr:FAD-binding oxidoreductase [Undibacterium sp.]